MKVNSLQERLIQFAADCIKIQHQLASSEAAAYYGKQLMRSSGSAALNYGEALGSESKKDFAHKLSLCLKESRESFNNLKILKISELAKNETELERIYKESNELVAMLVTAVKKAKSNL